MKKYTKIIVLSVVLLAIIALITLVMIFDVDLFLFRNLSIASMQQKKISVQDLSIKQVEEEQKNSTARTELQTSKNDFDVEKEKYENIDESTIAIVQEATKEEKYFVEYLWIVLGNYATANGVAININTPGSQNVTTQDKGDESSTGEGSLTQEQTPNSSGMMDDDPTLNSGNMANNGTNLNSGIKITIEGRYANIADFVFDVENDKSLRFKLDNIQMKYSGDNKIEATFDVLSLNVLK